MTKVVNFEDFEKEIEFTEMCFTNYRHIRYKFYGLFEFYINDFGIYDIYFFNV